MAPPTGGVVNGPYPSQLSHGRKDGKQRIMNMGVERAEAQEPGESRWLEPAEIEAPEVELALAEEPPPARRWGTRLFGALLILLALGWAGAFGWSLWRAHPALSLANAVSWAATASGPLVL